MSDPTHTTTEESRALLGQALGIPQTLDDVIERVVAFIAAGAQEAGVPGDDWSIDDLVDERGEPQFSLADAHGCFRGLVELLCRTKGWDGLPEEELHKAAAFERLLWQKLPGRIRYIAKDGVIKDVLNIPGGNVAQVTLRNGLTLEIDDAGIRVHRADHAVPGQKCEDIPELEWTFKLPKGENYDDVTTLAPDALVEELMGVCARVNGNPSHPEYARARRAYDEARRRLEGRPL